MLTAAVRDLHLSCPGRFLTDVRTSCAELWEHNPYLTSLGERDPQAEVIECEYPLINQSNRAPYHVIHGFTDFLSDRLRIPIKPTCFHGDIHLSAVEKSWRSQVWESLGQELPFWIISAGGKYDCTIKWWDIRRYQEIVDYFRGRILFVQVGAAGHHHPRLEGVLDLRGQTTLRQLVRLVHHAQGVLCGVTCLMHLAAAVETRASAPPNRACVVVAGGREPPHWEAYPHHQFIHTVGALPCCRNGGCWKSRTVRLGDDAEFDQPENLCTDPVDGLPHCMRLITAGEVIRRVELYFKGGAQRFLSAPQSSAVRSAVRRPAHSNYDQVLTPETVHQSIKQAITLTPRYPTSIAGRGIVICGGGPKYFPPAWVCIRMLRRLGCSLPIQLWYLGERELDEEMKLLLKAYDVECVNAEVVRQKHPMRILRGWELKAFALTHCRFREVLFLDGDNVPVANPGYLFETPQFKKNGAVFWPDVRFYNRRHAVWQVMGVPYRAGREFESGQILIDKARCWPALWLARWFNEHSDFFYQYILGDKETFYFAFRKLKMPYAMPKRRPYRLPATLCQHDFAGSRIFQHRNTEEWNIWLYNRKIKGFWHDRDCRYFLKDLQAKWDGGLRDLRRRMKVAEPGPDLERNHDRRSLLTVMISSEERQWVRKKTLQRLAAAGWGSAPMVCLAAGPADWSALFHQIKRSLGAGRLKQIDYLLFLHDDLKFNRWVRHNVCLWLRLQSRDRLLASLSNSGVRAEACDVRNYAYLAPPGEKRETPAFLISSALFARITGPEKGKLHIGDDRPIVSRLAEALHEPVAYHCPSLVQIREPVRSAFGLLTPAVDYDPSWRRPPITFMRQSDQHRGRAEPN